jgi:DNA-binding NtrC family response regulator
LRSDSQDASGILFNKPCHMPKEVLQFERRLISQALATANGRITHAAKWLGIGRQRLAYIIETRHPDLLKERNPVRRRSKKTSRKKH